MSPSFHYFQKLSAEVREMIWMETLTHNRVIVFDFKENLRMWLRLTPEPALFYVNQESKHYASKYYKKFICRPHNTASKTQTTHINPDNDTCYFLTPIGLTPINEKMFHKMCAFLDDNYLPYCAGVRPRRWAFDVKVLISRGASAEYRARMFLWMGCVVKRMSWCHAVLGDEQVDEFCIMITDDNTTDIIRQSDELHRMKISRIFNQELKPKIAAAKEEFEMEILKICENVAVYRSPDGSPQTPAVSFGMIELGSI
ncbi:hypothetical protein BofuT4_P074420.1 [Botrytis cinerea T4]|uniref:2EXR domain-containing protein n=1 Tax=Botryotinia fuckeliana (strain T4) TaxID=999810 RepID=G2XP34_BOTF4|nr:hypothetical protein BofuT4_P074420.1 [Botrytis cinerea T4]